MAGDHFIFIGFELSTELERALEECREQDRVYLEDPAYLERISIDGERHIGRRVENGTAADRLEDTARNVVSLLARLAPSVKLSARRALLLGIDDPGPAIDGGSLVGFDYSGLID